MSSAPLSPPQKKPHCSFTSSLTSCLAGLKEAVSFSWCKMHITRQNQLKIQHQPDSCKAGRRCVCRKLGCRRGIRNARGAWRSRRGEQHQRRSRLAKLALGSLDPPLERTAPLRCSILRFLFCLHRRCHFQRKCYPTGGTGGTPPCHAPRVHGGKGVPHRPQNR